jgi:hypothetical protein
MKLSKFSFTIILGSVALHLVLKSTAMRLQIFIILLLSATMAAAQQVELTYDTRPDVHVSRVNDKNKTIITTNKGFQRGQIIDVMMIGAIEEFELRETVSDKREFGDFGPTAYFISNDSAIIDLLPSRATSADMHLPNYPHEENIDYRQIRSMRFLLHR